MTGEKVGDIILGDFLVDAYHETSFVAGVLQIDSECPLTLGRQDGLHWTRHEVVDGWKRSRDEFLPTSSVDPSRATAEFRVVSVETAPASTGRDAGYGGGPRFVVERVDNPAERIFYTRRCCYTTDASKPATILRHDPPKPVTEKSTKAETWAEIQRLRGSLE